MENICEMTNLTIPKTSDLTEKRAPGWLGYIGDYFINHYKDPRIPIKQPV